MPKAGMQWHILGGACVYSTRSTGLHQGLFHADREHRLASERDGSAAT